MMLELLNTILVVVNLFICLIVAKKIKRFNTKLEKIEKLAKTNVKNPKLAKKLLNQLYQ